MKVKDILPLLKDEFMVKNLDDNFDTFCDPKYVDEIVQNLEVVNIISDADLDLEEEKYVPDPYIVVEVKKEFAILIFLLYNY